MLDVRNAEINVDEIMRRIQEKVRLRRESGADARPAADAAESWRTINQLLDQADEFAPVGINLPMMSHTRGLRRMLAIPVARIFLRLAQLITRDQRAFNEAVVASLRAQVEQQRELARRLRDLESRIQNKDSEPDP
jgi:hypothetical protein